MVQGRLTEADTPVSPAKTAEPIEMLFGLRTLVGTGNHVFDGGPDPTMGRGSFFRGWKGRAIVKNGDTV